ADAALVARAIDQAGESAHMRADGFAAMPMLRAGIETDAATLQDMAKNEALMKAAPDEIIEVVQTRGGQDTSVLRLPATAPALAAAILPDGTKLGVAARTELKSQSGATAGAVAVAELADLAAAQRAFAAHATGAALATTPRLVIAAAKPDATSSTVPLAT